MADVAIETVVKLARKGYTPSQIGTHLRDSHAIPDFNAVTNSKIIRILKIKGLAPSIPEDLHHLIRRAVNIRKHLSIQKKDTDAKYRLILVESRIHRLSRYYRRTRKLPANWKYTPENAASLLTS